MREIEIKARIANKTGLLKVLADQKIILSEPVTQHDRVYGLPGVAGAASGGQPWLRIRTESSHGSLKHYFTLKKSISGQLDSIEHETLIDDDTELEKIIEHLNFTPFSDLTKTRQKAKVRNIEVCIDHIDDLGDFVEAEMLCDDDVDPQLVQDELWQLLTSLGVSRTDEVHDGYDVLMNKHLGR
jgi:adenylate cyclase class 2